MVTLFEFTDANFSAEVLEMSHHQLVLVDFTAEWCGPCHMLAPVIANLNEEWHGAVRVGHLDIDAQLQTAAAYDVLSIPTLLLFKNGEPVERIVGYQPKPQLMARLQPHVNSAEKGKKQGHEVA